MLFEGMGPHCTEKLHWARGDPLLDVKSHLLYFPLVFDTFVHIL